MAVDRVLDVLLEMAEDAHRSVFTSDPQEPVESAILRGYTWLPGGAFRAREHASHSAFYEALASDPELRIFAPPREPFIGSSSGHGMMVQRDSLPGLVIASASATIVARGASTKDRDVYVAEVEATLAAFRRLVAGEEGEALTVIAFDGLSLAPDARLETPWGKLRAASELEAGGIGGAVPTAVVTFPRPVRYTIGASSKGEIQGVQELQAKVDHVAELLPLAAVLGIERDDYVVPGLVWSKNVDPVLIASGYHVASLAGPRARLALFHRFPPVARVGGDPLSVDEERALAEFSDVVERHYDAAIRIGVRRMISALLERTDPQDALIDAVMAMESLFGHGGTTEVAFRVTTALTLLLEPDPKRRQSLRKELGDIYSMRSTVVHGGEITPKLKLNEQKERAIRVAIEALRALFSARPHLIADRERGIKLVLGAAEP